ncbi:MAG: alpha/beta hydrolase [Cyanobacteria bacterium P01_F01_bin.86]
MVQASKQTLNVPANVICCPDIEFGKGGQRPLRMNIVRPRILPESPMPILIWIHGGGWCNGDKEEGIQHLIPFASNGYFGASIEYRLSHEAIFPAQLEDCKCAIRFLRAHANRFHLDADHIGAWGVSAGGHLAALLGTTHHVRELEGEGGWENISSRIQAVCDWFGPTDFLKMNQFPGEIDHDAADSPESMLIGGPIQENKKKAAQANPITYISEETAPFLIMHGDDDLLVPLNQSQLLFAALKKVNVEVDFEIIAGGGHGKHFKSPERLEQIKRFFNTHLCHQI